MVGIRLLAAINRPGTVTRISQQGGRPGTINGHQPAATAVQRWYKTNQGRSGATAEVVENRPRTAKD